YQIPNETHFQQCANATPQHDERASERDELLQTREQRFRHNFLVQPHVLVGWPIEGERDTYGGPPALLGAPGSGFHGSVVSTVAECPAALGEESAQPTRGRIFGIVTLDARAAKHGDHGARNIQLLGGHWVS